LPEILAISPVDKDGSATRGMAAIDITPAIADQVGFRKVEIKFGGGPKKHARRRLVAARALGGRVVADFDAIERKRGDHVRVHLLDDIQTLGAAAYVGLVGGDNQQEAGGFEQATGVGGVGVDVEFLERGRRKGPTIADDRSVDDAVAIEEHGAAQVVGWR